MISKLKKIFSLLLKKKLFSFVLIIGGLLSPLYSVQAAFKWYYLLSPHLWFIGTVAEITGWGTELIGTKLFAYIAALVTTILQIPLFFANVFLWIAGVFLDLTTSPTFINLSYTKLDNPIIRMGWTVTRDLANMGIVLGLIVIGVATILRIEGYQAKKTLPVLIIIALLINFTPVLLGIIVDASNIFMNFFLQGSLETSGFIELMKNQGDAIVTAWQKAAEAETPAEILAPLGKTVALTFYGFIAGFIFIVFAFLFIMRYIAIWILVILSPLAFVAYILPATKKYFDKWWTQFLNWCFIGVWAAFFLYLSNGLLALSRGQGLYGVQKLPIETIPGEAGAPATTELPGLLNDLLPYYVIIGFLVLGLVATLSISAYGASAMINFAKTKGKATVRGAAKGAGWVGKQAAKGVGRYVEEKTGLKEKVGKVSEKVSKVPALRWFLPEKVKKYGEFRPAIDEAKAEAKTYKTPVLMDDVMTGAAIGKRAGGFTLETIMRGDSEDIFEAGRRKFGKNLTDEQLLHNEGFRKVMKRTLEVEKEGGYLNDVIRRDPRLAALLTGESWAGDYATMTEKQAIQRATSEARGGHIANWEKQVISKEHLGLPITESLMERGREPFENIARNVKQGVETVQESIDTLFSDYVNKELSRANAALANMVKLGDPKNTEVAWGLYREQFKKDHKGQEGFFVALDSQRFRDLGYRRAKYTPPEVTGVMAALVKEKPGVPPTAVDTGEARKAKREAPDVGKVSRVPIMITRKMKEELKKKGFSDQDISKMKPEDAWKELGGML